MQDLRTTKPTTTKQPTLPKFNWSVFILNNKRLIYKLLLLSIVSLVIFMPQQTALTIAYWVNNFIGTLVRTIKFN